MRGRDTADYGVNDSEQVNDAQQSGDKNQNNYPGSQNEENITTRTTTMRRSWKPQLPRIRKGGAPSW